MILSSGPDYNSNGWGQDSISVKSLILLCSHPPQIRKNCMEQILIKVTSPNFAKEVSGGS